MRIKTSHVFLNKLNNYFNLLYLLLSLCERAVIVAIIAEKRIPKMIPTITQFLKSVPLNEALRVKGPAIKPTTNM